MSYCIYLRKSRADLEAEAHGEGETLARHEHALLTLAEKLRLPIGSIYREIVSGETIAARPVMQKLLDEVERGCWEGVLVMEVERLARGDTMDQGQVAKAFQCRGTKIITPVKTYDPCDEFDEEYFEFGLFMSRREFKTINRRIQRGRIASVKEGKYIASAAPYGYRRVKIKKDKGYTLEPVPEQAQIVRTIFDWYVNGIPQPDGSCRPAAASIIAGELDRLQIKPANGNLWSPHSIRDILKNPVYIGKIRWGFRKEQKKYAGDTMHKRRTPAKEYLLIDGLHPAIIDDITFRKAAERMNANRKNTVKSTILQNSLSGLVYCGKCGSLMTRLAPNSKTKYPVIKCPNRYCDCVSAPLDLVERSILSGLADWLEKYKLELQPTVDEAKTIKLQQSALADARRQLETLNRQLDTTYTLLEQGVYSVPVFTARQKNISDSIRTLTHAIEDMEAACGAAQSREEQRSCFLPKVEHILISYEKMEDAASRNRMLKEVLARVVYQKDVRNSRTQRDLASFHIEIFPNI